LKPTPLVEGLKRKLALRSNITSSMCMSNCLSKIGRSNFNTERERYTIPMPVHDGELEPFASWTTVLSTSSALSNQDRGGQRNAANTVFTGFGTLFWQSKTDGCRQVEKNWGNERRCLTAVEEGILRVWEN
jgi:hypothetical protein